jgi:imidazolonepropionase-like amidohydrolase
MSAVVRSVLLALAIAGALTPATPLGGQGGPDSGRFTIYKLQHAVGAETWSQTTTGEQRELKVAWAFRYLGSNVRLSVTLSSAADGTPRQLEAHGQTSTLTDVDLSVALSPDSAVIVERGARRVVPSSARAFPMFYYPPVALEEALFRYCRGGSPSCTTRLLPGGQVTVTYRGTDTLPGPDGAIELRRYAVGGLLWGRQSMWATADGRIVAVVNGDAELDRFEAVRTGYEHLLGDFVRGAVRDGIADLAAAAVAAPPKRTGAYAIVGARIVDGTGATPVDNGVIIVRAGRIEAMGPATTVRVPAGLPREDARGKTIIPGLWDMHVHFEQVEWPAAQLAAGVTTARDVGNEFELATGLRDAIAAGRVPGPRLLLAGLIDGAPDGLGTILAATPDEARSIVQRYHAAGHQQIKIYGSLPPALVPVVTAEAHRFGMTVTGHVPQGMNARQFVEAGADQINHFGYVLPIVVPPPPPGQPRPPIDFTTTTAKDAIAFFMAHGTVVDPTLARSEQNSHPKDTAFSVFEPGAAHAPPELLEVLNASGTRGDVASSRMANLARSMPLVVALMRAGVPIVAGTDLVVPGHSIARELELYVRAGMTPIEALQTATVVPAKVMGLDRESGSLAAGKRADLVILDGNPLDDISQVRRVHAVVAAGRMFLPAPLWKTAGFAP